MEKKLIVHYKRINDDYQGWSLWVWNKTDNKEGFEVKQSTIDSFGIIFEINTTTGLEFKEIGILPKFRNWENKEPFDRFFYYNGQKEIYVVEGDKEIYTSLDEIIISTKILQVLYDEPNIIRIVSNRSLLYDDPSTFKIKNKETGKIIVPLRITKRQLNVTYLDIETLNIEDVRSGNYFLVLDNKEFLIEVGEVSSVKADSKILGEIYQEDKIKLRVFSTAKELNIILKKEENSKEIIIPFNYTDNFIWEIDLSTSYYNYLYRYEAIYPTKKLYGIDPYAKLTYDNNKWAILSDDKTKTIEGPVFDISQTIIYEISIRDFTIDENSGVKNRGKYLGLVEENTTIPQSKEILTGISHMKELGVNAVQIMPFYDFEKDENSNDYDWGYMPVSFNSPDGWFSVNKKEKIREVKEMINAFHKNQIKVIMDVVYNHTAETKDKLYNFNAIAYDYYYRKKPDNTYYNGSGCGNEFKTESEYGRKFLLDSLKYWVKEYKIDGFRFDLMGLIDIGTVEKIIKELREIKPDIIIYGEPWHAGGTPVKGVEKGSQKNRGFAVFNDDLRDALKGNVFNINDQGYVQSGSYRDKVMKGIRGSIESFAESPLETINYVSCHDNHTLFDRLSFSNSGSDINTIIKQDKLAQAIIFVSQGIPFIHSGEEFLRTKKGNENSYNAGDDINKIEWKRKKDFYDVFTYYRDLIKLRKEHPAFRMKTKKEVMENIKFYEELGIKIKEPQIAFIIDGKEVNDSWNKILILINPEKKPVSFVLPEGNWMLEFDGNGSVKDAKKFSKEISLPPISLYIFSKN